MGSANPKQTDWAGRPTWLLFVSVSFLRVYGCMNICMFHMNDYDPPYKHA